MLEISALMSLTEARARLKAFLHIRRVLDLLHIKGWGHAHFLFFWVFFVFYCHMCRCFRSGFNL